MADYKKMYFRLMNATEKAINELIEAQKACEEIFILSEENEEKERLEKCKKLKLTLRNKKGDA